MPEKEKKKISTDEKSVNQPTTKPIDIPKQNNKNLKYSNEFYVRNTSSNDCICRTGRWCEFCLGEYDDFL